MMKTICMTIELTYDDELTYGDYPDAKKWFYDSILQGPDLQLGDFGDLGDTLGTVTVLEINE